MLLTYQKKYDKYYSKNKIDPKNQVYNMKMRYYFKKINISVMKGSGPEGSNIDVYMLTENIVDFL